MRKLDNVLLVDDDAITNFLNENLIRELEVADEVHVANDGKEALHFIQHHWDKGGNEFNGKLILLDINMPVMDGFEFLERFEKLPFHHKIKVILLTTSSNSRDIEKAKRYKVYDYILKPLNDEKLQAVIAKLN